MKKNLLLSALFLSSILTFSTKTEAAELASNSNTTKDSIILTQDMYKVNSINPYVFEIPIVPTTERAKKLYANDPKMSSKIDFTEATFYDENHRELDKDKIVAHMDQINRDSRSLSGGSWASGSGYAYCIGMTVSHTNAFSTSSFKVDFEHRQQLYDKINRVYEKRWGSWVGDVTDAQCKVFRANETLSYSAYAGINYTLTGITPSLQTKGSVYVANYIRVGNDRYWQEVR